MRGGPFHAEQVKLVFDLTKHLTTLSAGSILAIVTFYEKLASRHWKALVSVSLACFVVSILTGIRSQFGLIDGIDEKHSPDTVAQKSFLLSLITFGLAMVVLAIYGVRNF